MNNVLRVIMQWGPGISGAEAEVWIRAEEDGLCFRNDKDARKSEDAILRGVKDALLEAG